MENQNGNPKIQFGIPNSKFQFGIPIPKGGISHGCPNNASSKSLGHRGEAGWFMARAITAGARAREGGMGSGSVFLLIPNLIGYFRAVTLAAVWTALSAQRKPLATM